LKRTFQQIAKAPLINCKRTGLVLFTSSRPRSERAHLDGRATVGKDELGATCPSSPSLWWYASTLGTFQRLQSR